MPNVEIGNKEQQQQQQQTRSRITQVALRACYRQMFGIMRARYLPRFAGTNYDLISES